MSDLDETFHEIIMAAIERARKVPCDLPEFIDGLERMIGELECESEAAQEGKDREDSP